MAFKLKKVAERKKKGRELKTLWVDVRFAGTQRQINICHMYKFREHLISVNLKLFPKRNL